MRLVLYSIQMENQIKSTINFIEQYTIQINNKGK